MSAVGRKIKIMIAENAIVERVSLFLPNATEKLRIVIIMRALRDDAVKSQRKQ
jgi:hypothetical protein